MVSTNFNSFFKRQFFGEIETLFANFCVLATEKERITNHTLLFLIVTIFDENFQICHEGLNTLALSLESFIEFQGSHNVLFFKLLQYYLRILRINLILCHPPTTLSSLLSRRLPCRAADLRRYKRLVGKNHAILGVSLVISGLLYFAIVVEFPRTTHENIIDGNTPSFFGEMSMA